MFEFIINNLYAIVPVIFTFLIAWYFYYKSKLSKSIVSHFTKSILQLKSHPDVIIKYKNRNVNRLCRLLLLIYNNGNSVIRNSDFPKKKLPTIHFEDGVRLISFNLLEKSNDNYELELNKVGDDMVVLEFDYLNPLDGFVLEILFDDINQPKFPYEFSAPVIGGDTATFNIEGMKESKYIFLVIPFMALASIFGIPPSHNPETRQRMREMLAQQPEWISIIEYIAVGLIFIVCIAMFVWILRKSRIPKFAKKYFKEKKFCPECGE